MSLNEMSKNRQPDLQALAASIQAWGKELGFQQTGISDVDLEQAETRLSDWLARKFHGEMDYMQRHGLKRSRPGQLVPGTVRVISARMDYLPAEDPSPEELLDIKSFLSQVFSA